MANRRQGHGGRPYYNNGPVNPWQGGNVPGGNATGSAFNSASPSNLLSQLTEPQAQLALALTKLLQPQQQVPSLLTMDTINPLHNRGGYGPNKNNYPQRGRVDLNRRVRHDFNKRNEPYNKMNNRNARDTEFKRRRGNSNKSDERKIQAHRTTVASNKPNKSPSTKASVKPEKSNEVKPVDDEKPEPTGSAADTADTSVKDTCDIKSEDESKEEKREWKEERSTEEVAETTAEPEVKEPCAEGGEIETVNESALEKKPENDRYAAIPADLLHCLICQKSMWDGESFEKHMNGRAHQQMFEKVEESYKIKADMMREAIRLAEEKNNIEMDRMKRLGKKTKAQQRSRCAMCDLEFYGQLFVHRKSASHQKLKHFLHPRCNYCNKEFPTRMEWENHRHSPEHLRKKVEVDKKKDSIKDEDEILMDDDECFIVIDSTGNDEQEDPNALTDLTDDLTDLQLRIPTYKVNRAVGLSLIAPTSGFFCKPCSRFFLTEEASQLHAQSRMHFNSFIKILNEKIAENEEKKRKAVEEDDEGNWKRRKASKDDDEKNDNNESMTDSKETKEEVDKIEDSNVMYDPADAFTSTDPNDVCLNVENIKKEIVADENEEVTIKTEIDEVEIKTEDEESPTKTTNVKNNNSPRRTRTAKKSI